LNYGCDGKAGPHEHRDVRLMRKQT